MSDQPPTSSTAHSSQSDPQSAFVELVMQYLDNLLSDAETAALVAELQSSAARRELFVTLCVQSQELVEQHSRSAGHAASNESFDDSGGSINFPVSQVRGQDAAPDASDSLSGDLSDAMVLPAIRFDDRDDTSDEVTAAPPIWQMPQQQERQGWTFRYAAAAAVVLMMLGGLAVLLMRSPGPTIVVVPQLHSQPASVPQVFTPVLPEVARALSPAVLELAAGSVWAAPDEGLKPGNRLPAGMVYLSAGLASLRLDSGVTMIVEGPAQFEVTANAADLRSGRLVATVPVAARGFSVQTSTGRLVDLGTEFGVDARLAGQTGVEVFQGKVEARPQRQAPGTIVTVLTEGQAAAVSPARVAIDPNGAMPQRYVRRISSQATSLDLVDLIAGGDGTTRRRGLAIDPAKGLIGALAPTIGRDGDGLYHPVAGRPVLDGTFIPNGDKSPTHVSSTGKTFAFPLNNGRGYDHIWIGSRPDPKASAPTAMMDGIDFAKPERAALLMHANMGMTIDLAAVRRLHPNKTASRFRCIVGNEEPKPKNNRTAGVFVLVDGQPKFAMEQYIHSAGPMSIDVPLAPTDRFLTLVVTDGNDDLFNDGILWGNPSVDLNDK